MANKMPKTPTTTVNHAHAGSAEKVLKLAIDSDPCLQTAAFTNITYDNARYADGSKWACLSPCSAPAHPPPSRVTDWVKGTSLLTGTRTHRCVGTKGSIHWMMQEHELITAATAASSKPMHRYAKIPGFKRLCHKVPFARMMAAATDSTGSTNTTTASAPSAAAASPSAKGKGKRKGGSVQPPTTPRVTLATTTTTTAARSDAAASAAAAAAPSPSVTASRPKWWPKTWVVPEDTVPASAFKLGPLVRVRVRGHACGHAHACVCAWIYIRAG